MVKDVFGVGPVVTATAVALALSSGAMAQSQEQPSDTQPQAEQGQAGDKVQEAQQQLQEEQAEEPAAGQQAEEQPAAEEEAGQQAAEEQPPSPPEGPFIAEQEGDTLLASELQGLTILGADGEEIGAINDVILHPEGGIFGATVSVGGFLGIGAKEVALSWTQFEYMPEEQLARVDLTREQLEETPDFKSLADIRAEEEAAAAQQQMQQQQQQQPGTATQ